MPRQLTVSPSTSTPFKSSFLAIPPTPFSPCLPINPPEIPPFTTKDIQHQPDRASRIRATIDLLPPPEPLHWLWHCHKCNHVYKLGVTRRCLDDGHFFCAGMTTVKRRIQRHQACASQFDYSGWKMWGTWRRRVSEQIEAAEALHWAENIMDQQGGEWQAEGKEIESARRHRERYDGTGGNRKGKRDCWAKCDYPSECRWGKECGVKSPVLLGMQNTTPATATAPITTNTEIYDNGDDTLAWEDIINAPTADSQAKPPKLTFEEILGLDISDRSSPDYLEPLSLTTSSSSSHDQSIKFVTEGETRIPSVEQLVQSIKRRTHKSQGGMPSIPSPLAANLPTPEEEESAPKEVFGGAKLAVDDFELGTGKVGFDLSLLQQKANALMQSLRKVRERFQM